MTAGSTKSVPAAEGPGHGRMDDRPRVDCKARLQIPPHPVIDSPAAERTHNWDEVELDRTDERSVFIEASRCLQCPDAPYSVAGKHRRHRLQAESEYFSG